MAVEYCEWRPSILTSGLLPRYTPGRLRTLSLDREPIHCGGKIRAVQHEVAVLADDDVEMTAVGISPQSNSMVHSGAASEKGRSAG